MTTQTGKSGWSLAVSESQLPNAVHWLHFATVTVCQYCVNAFSTVGVLNWSVGEPLQDYHLSLVGRKFAGFFFSQKNTLCGLEPWAIISM
jgi:hypothetical protein